MKNNPVLVANAHDIRCVCCGVRIRRDRDDDSPRICLKCFYVSLNKQLALQRRARAGEGVSDR